LRGWLLLLMLMLMVMMLVLLLMVRNLRVRLMWGRLLKVRRVLLLLLLLQRRRMGMEIGWILIGSRRELRLRRRRLGVRKPVMRMRGRNCSRGRGRGRGSGHRRRMLRLEVRVRVRRVLMLLLGLQGRWERQLWRRDGSGSRRLRICRLGLLGLGSVPQSCHWVGPPQLLLFVARLALVGRHRVRA
jgi:hypothetical protein